MQFDIALIGSGISCTQTLLQILDKLEKDPIKSKKIQIAVVEKDGEFWKGVAYGKKSSVNSLIITTLAEFIPADEKESFLDWLKTTRNTWLAELRKAGGETADHWIKHNKSAMEKGKWDEIYIPRFLYGLYLDSRVKQSIKNAEKVGIASITQVYAETTDLDLQQGGIYQITLHHGEKKMPYIFAKQVVLTVGSGNNKPIPVPLADKSSQSNGFLYINDPYYPSLETQMHEISSRFSAIKEQAKRNILVLGSNASSLEILYFISTSPSLSKSLNKIIVVSHSGMLAHRITPDHTPNHIFENLEKLALAKDFTAEKLFETLKTDIELATAKGAALGDLVNKLNDQLERLLNKLDPQQEKEFYSRYGSRYSKLIRRAGAEYRDGAQKLLSSGKLILLKGSFLKIKKAAAGLDGLMMEYSVTDEKKPILYPLHFPIIINCGGFEDLGESSLPLVANLVQKKICNVNRTRRGFEVSENFEAAKNLYVMGPLLAGIFNEKVKHWHVENLKRIHDMAPLLANTIVNSLHHSSPALKETVR
jgi:uncharacterized NAD(P)/FAD-binding protein YdhS